MEYVTVRQVAKIIKDLKVAAAGAWAEYAPQNLVGFRVVGMGDARGFSVNVRVYGPDWNILGPFALCAENGRLLKLQKMRDLAGVVAAIIGGMRGDYWEEMFVTLDTLEVEKFTKRSQSVAKERKRLQATKAAQAVEIADIDAQMVAMIGWEAGNVAQRARKAELMRARAVMVADGVLIDARLEEMAP